MTVIVKDAMAISPRKEEVLSYRTQLKVSLYPAYHFSLRPNRDATGAELSSFCSSVSSFDEVAYDNLGDTFEVTMKVWTCNIFTGCLNYF